MIFSSVPPPPPLQQPQPSLPLLLPYSINSVSNSLLDTVSLAHHMAFVGQNPLLIPINKEDSLDMAAVSPSTSNGSPTSAMKRDRCVGCGSESSIRVHYGASSCHGCKAFFRRSVFEGRNYICSADNNCDITNESRNRCRACRLRNCLEGGMNPKHVREERNKQDRIERTLDVQCSDSESGKRQSEEHPLTMFLCALEKQTEMLTDDDVKGNDVMGEWSRDISITFGLQNPQLVIKRSPMDWSCTRIMEANDLYKQWYRAFVLHADWAMGIPDFRVLSLSDQTKLFKQNFMTFGWIVYAFKCYQHNQHAVGIPLGNGAYIPYSDEEQKRMEQRWVASYGVVCKKLMDLIVKPMIELDMAEEEYCLLKALSLFQQDCLLSENGALICSRVRDRLLEGLSTHIERRFANLSPIQRSIRALKSTLLLPTLSYIGQVESSVIQHLSPTDLQQLSGVPMELVGSVRSSLK
ncbi:hypothetical protein RB195_001700 [Necator americanus]|uniref:Ligand-binding domain of nuclear hormone receptor n=1 Tax=Necator americanus TaxID=51031 RepID=A0ABR1DFJ4_NECAM